MDQGRWGGGCLKGECYPSPFGASYRMLSCTQERNCLIFVGVLSQAAITKYLRLSGLKNRKTISCSSGGQKSEIRLLGWSGSGEMSLPGL